MIKLIGFGRAFGMPDPSPFVVKVDAFLRFSGLPYEYVANVNALRSAPKKKLPIIKDEGQVVADSYFIVEYLKEKYRLTIDDGLTPAQLGQAHLMCKSLEENFYWCLVYSRWMDDATWALVKQTLFGKMPAPLKLFVPAMIRKGVRKDLYAHGIGRHSDKEVLQIFEHSLQSLSQILNTQPYFFGNKATTFDATAYGLLASFILADIDNAFNRQARTYANLVEYCQRIQNQFYANVQSTAQATA